MSTDTFVPGAQRSLFKSFAEIWQFSDSCVDESANAFGKKTILDFLQWSGRFAFNTPIGACWNADYSLIIGAMKSPLLAFSNATSLRLQHTMNTHLGHHG